MAKIFSGQVDIKGNFGIACLGKQGEIVSKYILPLKLTKEKLSLIDEPPVLYNGAQIGTVKTVYIDGDSVLCLLRVDETIPVGLYTCKFNLLTLFGEKVAHNFMLEEVLINSVTIYEPVNQNC